MPKLNRQQIQNAARAVLQRETGGIRWSQLLKAVETGNSDTPQNSIHGAIHTLLASADDIVKVARGIYQMREYQDQPVVDLTDKSSESANPAIHVVTKSHVKITLVESDFYESFAQWLEDTEEATVAAAVGGSILKQKWGTPDVIAVLRPQAQDLIKFEIQLLSAEVKIDPAQPVVAFGQAVAYRFFSHKRFIEISKGTSQDDLARLKALCSIHGVGLVIFDRDKETPDYTTLVPAQQANLDMFYMNEMVRKLLEVSKPLFKNLFP